MGRQTSSSQKSCCGCSWDTSDLSQYIIYHTFQTSEHASTYETNDKMPLFKMCPTQMIRLHDSFAGSSTTRCPSSSSSSSYSAPSLKSRHMYGLPSFALSGSSPIFLRSARSPSLPSLSQSSPSSILQHVVATQDFRTIYRLSEQGEGR